MADWRNVGNWHWKEKNCLSWAQKYLEKQLTGIEAEGDGIKAKVASVDSVTGDVDLNIRKGRLLAIYDVVVKLEWEATKGEDKLTGKIVIPEVAHDTDAYVYEVTANSTAAEKLFLKDFVRTKLTPVIGEKLENFTEDLKKENGSEMYIAGSDSTKANETSATTNTQLAKDFKEGKTGGSGDVGVGKTQGATFGTVEIKQTSEFMCSADDLYATLTDPQRVSVWTRAPAEIQPKVNSKFRLFGGHIEGEFKLLEPGKRIEELWRVATWPAGHYSHVVIELEQLSNSTRLSLKQTGVPLNEEDATKVNWDRYYWNSIKGSFG
ncbi:Co-chaperone [Coemansia sp. RSA 990]|nr:activator of Hsp90 ATPase [Coemansia mojavensis]KAJ1738279.1 Co-chaperone [Coemansia sp. RSA 1086]KAJ1746712.1 Co-chaperone [Coemansia sp. RSA 1821]KAJ1868866.1 Co-chaperone [Coemansia sp. RSA 990]KAJ2667592.1 Co-chaperone [Coemansia sp. RSA 1085]